MEINDITAALVSELEYIIGNECYNPNSYDGYRNSIGRGFRYPVAFSVSCDDGERKECKTRYKLCQGFSGHVKADDLKSAKYKFGSNELYICLAIIKALSFIEERYTLNFEELEKSIKDGKIN